MKLQTYLRRAKIEPEEFAVLLGVHKESVRLWLAGQVIPRRRAMQKIMEYTAGKVKPNDFFTEDG